MASSDAEEEPAAAFDYYTAVPGQENATVTVPDSSTLDATRGTCIMLPWAATGKGSGPAASWLFLEATLTSEGLQQPMLIVGGATAVAGKRGSELWVLGTSVQAEEPSSDVDGTLLTTLRVIVAEPPLRASRKPSGEGRAARNVEHMKLGILEAEEVEAKDIFTVRTLSAEEQHTFADHVRAQHANYGWYLVPNAVDTEGGDGVDRLKYYRHFSSVAVDGIAALNSATWRRKQLRDLFIQLVEEVVAPKIQSVETKAAVKAAAPRLADILSLHLETGKLLKWAPSGPVESATFVPQLSTGLPYPLRTHTAVHALLAPKLPEKKQGKQKQEPSASVAGLPSAKRSQPTSAGSGSKKVLVVTESEQSKAREAELDITRRRAEYTEGQYTKDMKSMMDAYKTLHAKYQTAVVLLSKSDQKDFALELLGVDEKWSRCPPPFDPGSRPFVEAEMTAAGPSSGSARKRQSICTACIYWIVCTLHVHSVHCICPATRSGVDANNVEKRPPAFEFATARKFKAEEYTEAELTKLSEQLFKRMPK